MRILQANKENKELPTVKKSETAVGRKRSQLKTEPQKKQPSKYMLEIIRMNFVDLAKRYSAFH